MEGMISKVVSPLVGSSDGRWVVCLMYQVGPSASWPRVEGDGLDDV